MELYPLLVAEKILDRNQTGDPLKCFLFNTTTNRGYSVDGLAALFCKKLLGTKKLKTIIEEFEQEHDLAPGKFEKEIVKLMKDFDDNGLVVFSETPL